MAVAVAKPLCRNVVEDKPWSYELTLTATSEEIILADPVLLADNLCQML